MLGGGGNWAKTYGGAENQAGNSIGITPDGDYFVLAALTLMKLAPDGTIIFRRELDVDREDADGETVDTLVSGRATPDGGFIAVGVREMKRSEKPEGANDPVDFSDNDIYLIKVDMNGVKEWSTTFGYAGTVNELDNDEPTGDEAGVSVHPIVTDGAITGYAVTGDVRVNRKKDDVNQQDYDVLVATVDAEGNNAEIVRFGLANTWTDSKTESYMEGGVDIRQAGTGFVVAANRNIRIRQEDDGNWEDTRNDTDAYLLALDSSLAATWEQTFGEAERDEILASAAPVMEKDALAEVIAAGSWSTNYLPYTGKQVAGYGDSDVYMLKTDGTGQEVWAYAYGTEDNETATCVQVAGDGYVICGASDSMNVNDNIDALLLKVDTDGIEKWRNTFGSYGYDFLNWFEFDRNSIVACGQASWLIPYANNTDIEDHEIYVIKADASGQINNAGRQDPEMYHDRM
jgi:hypothetical protein